MWEWLSTEQEMKEKETWQIIYWQVTKYRTVLSPRVYRQTEGRGGGTVRRMVHRCRAKLSGEALNSMTDRVIKEQAKRV